MKKPHVLALGVALMALPLIVEGPAFLSHVLDHVIFDLTIELTTHVFLLGIALAAYAVYKEIRQR